MWRGRCCTSPRLPGTLPDIAAVSDSFDREYGQAAYEQKIAKLIRHFRANARTENREGFDAWTEAVRTLRPEDHYLLVLLDAAGSGRPLGDVLKLWATALAIVLVMLVIVFLAAR